MITRTTIATCALAVLAALTLGACASSATGSSSGQQPQTQYRYCVDQSGRVVDQSQCNSSATPGANSPHVVYYIVITNRQYRSGQTVASSDQRIPADDPEARTNAGLPGTGDVPEHQQVPAGEAPAPEAPAEHPAAPVDPVEVHPVIVDAR